MTLLGIDTATSAITVGLLGADGRALSRSHVDPRGHTEHLTPLIGEVLAEAGLTPGDLTGIVVGTGPGPFTGLRVGLVTAETLGFALGIPVHGVCSLDAVALAVAREVGGEFLVATDARRKEVYWARYAVAAPGGMPERLTGPFVRRPQDLPESTRDLPTGGRGPQLYPELFARPVGPLDADAADLLLVGAALIAAGEPLPVTPLYLRRPDALTLAQQGRA